MDPERRQLLQAGALSGAVALLPEAAAAQTRAAVPPGKPGDFDFLAGEWRIAHRRPRKEGGWDEFEGEATCWTILGGVGSVEELRIPARNFSGMGLRLLDVEKKIWSDHWVNARSGVLTLPGQTGGFVDGAGVFRAEDEDAGQRIVILGIWDEITPRSCRWRQRISRDGERTWVDDWIMHWTLR
jgi:hypothetical protein